MSSKKLTMSDGLSAMAFGATMATGIIAGVEMEQPQSSSSSNSNQEEVSWNSNQILALVNFKGPFHFGDF